MVTQREIARRVGLDVSTVSKILTRRAGTSFCPATVDRVFQTARALRYDLSNIKHFHRRQHERFPVNLPGKLSIYYRRGGVIHDQGTCTIRDLSAGGAALTHLVLRQGGLPLEPFQIGLRARSKSMVDDELRGDPVRFTFEEGHPLMAVQFQRLIPDREARLLEAISRFIPRLQSR